MLIALDKLNAKVFAKHLHTGFKLHCDGAEPLPLELIAVNDNDPSPAIELFSLHFRGPAAPNLPQQTHRLEHDKLGTFEIFLTAIEGDAEGITYESIFHRLRQAGPPSAKSPSEQSSQK